MHEKNIRLSDLDNGVYLVQLLFYLISDGYCFLQVEGTPAWANRLIDEAVGEDTNRGEKIPVFFLSHLPQKSNKKNAKNINAATPENTC